jgi:hypothetical protein
MKNFFIAMVIIVLGLTVGWFISRPKTLPQGTVSQQQIVQPSYTPAEEPYMPLEISITGSQNPQGVTKGGVVDKQSVAAEQHVYYKADGFHESVVYIKLGSTVIFHNESGREMWIASAPHPTHTAYPEFDQKKSVKQGELYRFTFAKVGAWKYHNHIFPDQTGTVVVSQ